MEGDNVENISGSGSRWNPTKEQIDMLEGLYKQGLRTPSADQIQQITNRLKAFGHIEGKNVFYWFQNHKARQRQKQKQENSINYYTRLLHKTPFFPPSPNVVCSPFYVQYPDHVGIYQQQPKLLLQRGLKRKPVESPKVCNKAIFNGPVNQEQNLMENSRKFFMDNKSNTTNMEAFNGHQTLDLFPQQPSGNLQSRSGRSSFGIDSGVTPAL